MEPEFPFKNVECFFLPAMDMWRRTSAGRHNRLHESVSPARVIPAALYRVTVANNPDGPTLTRNHDSVVHRRPSPSSLHQPQRQRVTKPLTTSVLNHSDNIILDREEPTRESVGTP